MTAIEPVAHGERLGRPWSIVLPVAFAIGSALAALSIYFEPRVVGSDAWVYVAAARAWLTGGDPWYAPGGTVGYFAGPPTQLVPYAPFINLSNDAIALIWVTINVLGIVWLLRKLRLPGYWLGFLPIFAVVMLGHIEVLSVILLWFGGRLGGIAAVVRPYMGLGLLAQQRWSAIAIGLAVLLVTVPLLPWQQFIDDREHIAQALVSQWHGDTVFGNPVAMVIAAVALASLGWRRALWLGAPLFWPASQHGYKLMALPLLTPVIAVFWALPIPGIAVFGVVAQAILERKAVRERIPAWLLAGTRPITTFGETLAGRKPEVSTT